MELVSEEGVRSSLWPQLPEKPRLPSLLSVLRILPSLRKGLQDLLWLCSLHSEDAVKTLGPSALPTDWWPWLTSLLGLAPH